MSRLRLSTPQQGRIEEQVKVVASARFEPAAAITAERLAPAGERVARAIDWAGLFLIARAAELG